MATMTSLYTPTFVPPVHSHIGESPTFVKLPVVIALVGLPARGKTYIAKKLTHYLNWIGITTETFNAGEYRRHMTKYQGHNFFDPSNTEADKIRKQCAKDALDDALRWIADRKGEVAVFDATNSTRDRREMIREIVDDKGYKLFFIESLCDDPAIVDANIKEVKITNPDYQDYKDMEKAVIDFMERIRHYELAYEPLHLDLDKELIFMKIINAGERFIVNRADGYIVSRIVYYLMNIRVIPRTIYLTRHGESIMNVEGKIGGDSDLSENGWKFAKQLADFFRNQHIPNLRVWTSMLKRTKQTAHYIQDYMEDIPVEQWKALNEISAGCCEGLTYEDILQRFPEQLLQHDKNKYIHRYDNGGEGVCEGMSYEEIQRKYPADFSRRDGDKYRYRYPTGESYQDLVSRLEPVIMQLEREENVLVICHQAVARCLLAYFEASKPEELPYIEVPLHTVIKLTPVAYGCRKELIPFGIPAVSTHRSKPKNIAPNRTDYEALETAPLESRPNFNRYY